MDWRIAAILGVDDAINGVIYAGVGGQQRAAGGRSPGDSVVHAVWVWLPTLAFA